jgi:DeoR/GlpR family transcriptional regulator of sugar metabolism
MGTIRRRDVVSRFNISREAARRDLLALGHLSLLRQEGRGRAAKYRCPDRGSSF